MSLISYRATALCNDGLSAITANAPFVIPGSAQVDDLAIVDITKDVNSATVTTVPSGWVLVSAQTNATGPIAQWRYQKVLVAGDLGTTPTWVFPAAGRIVGVMELFDDADQLATIPSSNGTSTGAATTSISAASTAVVATMAFLHSAWAVNVTGVVAPDVTVPGTHTAGGIAKTAFGSGINLSLRSGWLTAGAVLTGTYGPYVATSSSSAVGYIGRTSSYKPVPTPGNPIWDGTYLSDSATVRTVGYVLPSGAPVPTTGQLWPRGSGVATRLT